MARELSRVDRGDGFHEVQVAVDNTTISRLVVPNTALDQPGYQEMLDAHGRYHDNLIRIREGLAAL